MSDLVQVEFHGDVLWASRFNAEVFVAVKPICEALGLEWSSQTRRIQRDAVLSEGIAMMATPSRGGLQEALCLPLRLLNGWLFGIDERRVKREEVRQKIVQYKRECYTVLADHFLLKPSLVAASHAPVEGGSMEARDQPIQAINAQARLSTLDVGIQLAKTIKRAREDKPDDFLARAKFYAEFYCDIREEKNLDFNEVRLAAINAGASRGKIDLVKGLIDKACPDASSS